VLYLLLRVLQSARNRMALEPTTLEEGLTFCLTNLILMPLPRGLTCVFYRGRDHGGSWLPFT